MHRNRVIFVSLAMVAMVLSLTAVYWAVAHHRTWRRFHIVEPGVLYRSNLLPLSTFAEVLDRYRIRTVFSLTFTQDESIQRLCDQRGIKRYFHYLPGNGAGPDEPYLRFLEVIQDKHNHPVLVHCSAGVQRTGGAVALFRVVEQGWSFEDAIAEMERRGNDGNELQRKQLRVLIDRLYSTSATLAGDSSKLRR